MKIKRNAIKCIHCDKEVESKFRHDFHVHQCEVLRNRDTYIAADGGKDYLRRVGSPLDYMDISEFEGDE